MAKDKNPLNLITDEEAKYIREICSRIDYKAILEKAVINPGTIELEILVRFDDDDEKRIARVDIARIARFSFTNLVGVKIRPWSYSVYIRIQRVNVVEFDENDDYWEKHKNYYNVPD